MRSAAFIAQLLEDAHAHRARTLGAVQVHVEENDHVGRLPGMPAPGTVEPAECGRGKREPCGGGENRSRNRGLIECQQSMQMGVVS
jgi:hypothetical protein